ncbi:TPA: porin, partial [Escherichia coli]
MKRKVLAMLVPALLVAGAANAAEIYNKNGNKVELYGKMVGERILTDRESGEKGDNSQDTSYARVGVKGETQINPELTGYGQFELDLEASNRHNPDQTRLAYAGLSYKDFGSFDYGRNVGVAYDAEAFTDMFVEWGGDSWAGTDLFMTNRTNGVATYRNTDFFGMVEGLN